MYMIHKNTNYIAFENLDYLSYPKELLEWVNSNDKIINLNLKEAAVILQVLKQMNTKIGLTKNCTLVAVNSCEYRIFTFENLIGYILSKIEEYAFDDITKERKRHANIEILTRVLYRCGAKKEIPLDGMSIKEICSLILSLPDGYQYEDFFFTPILNIDTNNRTIKISHKENQDYSITCS